MTQQDDITQRVLTDDEIQDIADGFDIYGAKPEFARAIESALLSKLRAPVADERAAFEAWAVTEFTHPFMRPDPLIPDPDGSGDYADHDVQLAWSGFQQASAALASAPVAVERARPKMPAPMRAGDCYPDFTVMPVGTAEIYAEVVEAWARRDERAKVSAPVAGEAAYYAVMHGQALYGIFDSEAAAEACKEQGHPDAPLSVKPLYAAPQARPSDDKLWDQTLGERDEYHDMADKLANAIADHLLVEIGEHSSGNCPWMRALEAIENAAPQASAEYERGHADGWAAGWDQAIKQHQADKDGGQWDPQTPEQIAADMRNMARSEGFDWPEPDGGQQRAGDGKTREAVDYLRGGALNFDDAAPTSAEGIRSPSNACMHRNECRAMLDRQERAGDGLPAAPLRVFAAGIWTYDGTGQALSHTELDEAAFVTYRAALSAPQADGIRCPLPYIDPSQEPPK